MKLLIFSHSGAPGGAENALRHLVGLLVERHELEIILPSSDQGEAAYYQSLGIQCHLMQIPFTIPHFPSAVLHYASVDFRAMAAQMSEKNFDACVSNTIAILHGAILSNLMRVPHLTYAHEYLDDEELFPNALTAASYCALVEEASCGIVSCSNFVASQFSQAKQAHLKVLQPYDFALQPIARAFDPAADRVLQVIGNQSARKNPQFAVTLVKALRLRGLAVSVDIIGPAHSASTKVERILAKRQTQAESFGQLPDPYAHNLEKRVVTLLCAKTEPYGLTVPESLRRGIPVISSRSGGPQELLPNDLLFDFDNLDECARVVERVFSCYDEQVARARTLYEGLSRRLPRGELVDELDRTLSVLERPSAIQLKIHSLINRVKCVVQPPVDRATLARNIAVVAREDEPSWTAEHVDNLIASEIRQPGQAVCGDIQKFDVVPFSMSNQMENLYRNGFGLAIELAATFDDVGRLHMASYIVCVLNEMQNELGRPPKVLAVGDGMGIDALRLAAAGFEVSYIDFEKSNVSKIAALNFRSAQASNANLRLRMVDGGQEPYDAVVCLEVVEHIPRAENFREVLAGYLAEDGLLFVSECFNGIEDRWPTHLLENERFAGMLHLLLRPSFVALGANRNPYGKPFLFRKASGLNCESTSMMLSNRELTIYFINNQLDIGV